MKATYFLADPPRRIEFDVLKKNTNGTVDLGTKDRLFVSSCPVVLVDELKDGHCFLHEPATESTGKPDAAIESAVPSPGDPTREELKAKLDELGVKYAPQLGQAKLKELLAANTPNTAP